MQMLKPKSQRSGNPVKMRGIEIGLIHMRSNKALDPCRFARGSSIVTTEWLPTSGYHSPVPAGGWQNWVNGTAGSLERLPSAAS